MDILKLIGRGPGYILLAALQACIGGALALRGCDLSGYAMVLGAVNVAAYGGGAWKAHTDSRSGNGATQ